MSRRVFFVGTDTGVGKTALVCALLRWASRSGVPAAPFKPSASGDDAGPDSDVVRLLAAAALPASAAEAICPHRYAAPLAPGIADDPAPFFRPPAANAAPQPEIIGAARHALTALEARTGAALVLIEGAGGLHVPMPGGTWLPTWIRALATDVVVVGRAGLGTINHCLLTLDALAALDLPVAGFFLSDVTGDDDPSLSDNAQIIATARATRYLGTLQHHDGTDPAGDRDLLTPLLDALPG